MRKIVILFTLILVSPIAMGQSVSKQINDVKRSSEYLSAEATMETESTAYEVAEELLAKQIAEYANENEVLMNAPNVIVKDVAGKAEQIKMNRGTMVRVFLYVRKSDVLASNNTRVIVQKDVEHVMADNHSQQVNQPLQDEEKQVAIVQRTDVADIELVNEETAEGEGKAETETSESTERSVPANPVTEAEGDTSIQVIPEPEKEQEAYHEEVLESAQEASQESASVVEKSTMEMPEWKLKVIDDLLQSKTFTDAQRLLTRYRAERKVRRFGNPQDCRNPEESYWLIFDNQGNVITVLGEGNAERLNYKTQKKEALGNYSGMGAMWFTMSN